MKILVDADGSPVTHIAKEVAKGEGIPLILVCDTSRNLTTDYGEVVVVSKGMDAADFALINLVEKKDIVITGDYGVAAMALAKGAYPISHHGRCYSNENMDQMLFERHLNKKMRRTSSHYHQKGHKKRTKEDDLKFRKSLEHLIQSTK